MTDSSQHNVLKIYPCCGICQILIVVSSCCTEPLINIQWPSLSLITFQFKVYFVLHQYSHSCSLLVTIAENIFLNPFTFNLFVSLDLKWVSYRQDISESCFSWLIHSAISVFWLKCLMHLNLKHLLIYTSVILLFVFYMLHTFLSIISCITAFFVFSWLCCSKMFKFLSYFLLCIFYGYFLCGYYRDYI